MNAERNLLKMNDDLKGYSRSHKDISVFKYFFILFSVQNLISLKLCKYDNIMKP